jgi:phosphatidylglycerophosphatase C
LQKSIAFFDFDGTITRKDTLIELAKFAVGSASFYAGMIGLAPWLLAMKAGIISNEKAKEKMLTHFYKGYSLEKFNTLCQAFSEAVLPHLLRSDAMEEIVRLKSRNVEVVVVTASAENWVAPWCEKNDLGLIATQLEVAQNKITGKLKGANCNNDEKACRIRLQYNLSEYAEIYCYGDTKGDKAMLDLATHPLYKKFNG